MHRKNSHLIITESANGLRALGARPSADTLVRHFFFFNFGYCWVQLHLWHFIFSIYQHIQSKEICMTNVSTWMQGGQCTAQVTMPSGHLTPHSHATWSSNMMQLDNTDCCPLPEPQFLLLHKGSPAKFRHAIHKCEKQMGLKPYTLKLA